MKKILFALLLIQSVIAQPLTDALQSITTQKDLMGMTVAVVKNGQIVYTKGFGLQHLGSQKATTDSTMYRMASVSKIVAAMALMKLYDEGKFTLDEDVNAKIGFSLRNPNFPNAPITYRMLLNHTSSIVDGAAYGNFPSGNTSVKIADLMISGRTYYSSNLYGTRNPGTYFQYSNLNYGIIGTLVEKLSGKRFDVYVKEQILQPMGIRGGFNFGDINLQNLAPLYRKSGGVWTEQVDGNPTLPANLNNYVIGNNGLLFAPQGGLRISARDLAKIIQLFIHDGLYNGTQVLQAATVQNMLNPQWTYNGSNGDTYGGLFRSWGLGIHISTNFAGASGDVVLSQHQMKGHPGEAYGLVSDLYFDKAKKIGFVFATNGSGSGYSAGLRSGFYTLEESVFDAVQQYIFSVVSNEVQEIPATSIYLYPNPASNILRLSLPENVHQIVVLDNLGRQVAMYPHQQEILTHQLSAGLYWIILNDETGKFIAKEAFVKD